MIVSHKHKFIFIKSRKTAGSSVQIALSRICGESDIITPIYPESAQELQAMGFKGAQNYQLPFRKMTLHDWHRWFRKKPGLPGHATAAYIRRFVGNKIWNSYFKFSIERNPFDKAVSLYYWRTRNRKRVPSLAEYIASRPTPLSNWDIYAIDDQLAVDRVLRYEFIAEDLKDIANKLGFSAIDSALPKAKSKYRKDSQHYSEQIDSQSRAVIEDMCSRELSAFGYQWEEKA